MIITDRNQIDNKSVLILTSIGGSPIHEGHIRLLRDCKRKVISHLNQDNCIHIDKLKLLVVVNSDEFLLRKHNFVFQNEDVRAEIIDSIKDVDYTFIHHSDDQTIHNAIHYFQPHYFCKGGDRSSIDNLPSVEVEACLCYGTQIIFGVGGSDKVSSSSDLMKCVANHYLTQVPVKDWVNKIPRIINGYYPEKTIIYNIERLDEALDRCIDSKFY